MPEEINISPGGVKSGLQGSNPAYQGNNPAWGCCPGPIRPEYSTEASPAGIWKSRPGLGIPAWEAGLARMHAPAWRKLRSPAGGDNSAAWPAGEGGPAGGTRPGPAGGAGPGPAGGDASCRPSREGKGAAYPGAVARPKAQPGKAAGRPSRGQRSGPRGRQSFPAQPGDDAGGEGPAGAGKLRPSRGLLLSCAGPRGLIPAWGLLYRPSSYIPARLSNMPAWGLICHPSFTIIRPRLLFACFSIFLHI
jgi:hypothetical protein